MIPPPLGIRAVCDGACARTDEKGSLMSMVHIDQHSASCHRQEAWSQEVGG